MSNKIFLFASLAVLATAAASCVGVYAYFTDKKETASVFTVGEVDITLSESAFNSDSYTAIVPNHEIKKNPVVTNTGNTSAFIKLDIMIPYIASGCTVIENNQEVTVNELFKYTPHQDWEEYGSSEIITDETDNTIQYLKKSYIYQDSLPAGESTPAVFESIYLQNIKDGQDICGQSFDLPVVAHAIQSKGLTIETAFSEYDNQLSIEGGDVT